MELGFYFTTEEKEIYRYKNHCPTYMKELTLEFISSPSHLRLLLLCLILLPKLLRKVIKCKCLYLYLYLNIMSISVIYLYILVIILSEADNMFVSEERELKACLPVGNCGCETLPPQRSKGWKQSTHNPLVF